MRICCVNSTTGIVENVSLMGEDLPPNAYQPLAPPAGVLWIESDVAGVGWSYSNGQFIAPPAAALTPEQEAELARRAAIEAAISSDSVVQALKLMTNAEYDAWWSANVANAAQAIGVLKRVVRLVLRRL